ncbi:MAG: hypothetical protein QME94_19420 [Anaerolineae bacterium]|nr:hypothetical protein [Anaerolineae bacterium]
MDPRPRTARGLLRRRFRDLRGGLGAHTAIAVTGLLVSSPEAHPAAEPILTCVAALLVIGPSGPLGG